MSAVMFLPPLNVRRLDVWVSALRTSPHLFGGIARYIQISPRFRRKVSERTIASVQAAVEGVVLAADQPDIAETANLDGASFNVHFCMPRFDAMVSPLMQMFAPAHLKPVLESVGDEAADPTSDCPEWACETLDQVFGYDPLMSLALAIDILQEGERWVHARDQRKGGTFQSICISTRMNDAFLKILHTLVDGPNPLALAEGYRDGVARQVAELLKGQMTLRVPGSKIRAAMWPSRWEDRMAPLIKAREFVRWIEQHMAALFPCASLQASLSPFDLEHVPFHSDPVKEEDYLRARLEPLATSRGIQLDSAVAGFLACRPLADEIRKKGTGSVQEYRGQSLRDRGGRHPEFAKMSLPALVQFLGNGGLEGDFSSLCAIDLFKRGCSRTLLRAVAKVRLDGPHPSDFEALPRRGRMESLKTSSDAVEIDKWIEDVLRMYERLFGTREMGRRETKMGTSVVVYAQKGVRKS